VKSSDGEPRQRAEDSGPASTEILTIAVNHAWSWFEVHAVQRQNFVNFFLIAIAFLSAAYVGALTGKLHNLAAADCLVGLAISLAFFLIDLRNRELIRAGEQPLKELQDRLADLMNIESLRILESIERPQRGFTSLGKVVRAVHLIAMAAFVVAGIYALAAR
jgi:hypothetical protein